MSTPSKEFWSLSIGKQMPITRSQARRELQQQNSRQGNPKALTSHGILPSIESDIKHSDDANVSSSNSNFLGHSGLTYDLRGLSPDAIIRAAIGFRSRFSVDDERSRTFKDEVNSYHAIQLVGPVAIRIFSPASGFRKVECTCDAFQRSRSLCTHIYWLYDSLNVVLLALPTSATNVVTNGNVLSSITDLYISIGKRIAKRSLNDLIVTARIDTRTGSENETSDDDRSTNNQDDPDKVNQMIQDMLAVFDDRKLPEDFEHLTRTIPKTLSSATAAIVPGDVLTSLFRLARFDKGFRRLLRNYLTRNICARNLLTKLYSRAKEVFELLDDYAMSGPETSHQLVARCADRIRQVVDQIGRYMDERAPLNITTKARAAEILVNLLIQVCNRNKDIYEDMTWRKTAPDPHDIDDRNLYVNLIGDPHIYAETLEGRFFILDVLSTFAPDERIHLSDRLEVVSEKLKLYCAPHPFILRLDSILAEDQPAL